VRQEIQDGADFIKIYNGLSREAFYATADECKRKGIAFVVLPPDSVTTSEAAAAGQRSIEHLDAVLLDCSRDTAWLRRSRVFIPDQRMLDSFDPARAGRLFAAYVRHGTWHCPTLSVFQAAVFMGRSGLCRQSPGSQPAPRGRFLEAKPARNIDRLALDRAVLEKTMQVTAMMFRAGAGLLAGTDTGYPYVLPGFGLHDELELMASADVPVPAVLRIATLAPAQFLGREDQLAQQPAASSRTSCCSMPIRCGPSGTPGSSEPRWRTVASTTASHWMACSAMPRLPRRAEGSLGLRGYTWPPVPLQGERSCAAGWFAGRRAAIRRASMRRASAVSRAVACARRSSSVSWCASSLCRSRSAVSLFADRTGPSWMPIRCARKRSRSAVTVKCLIGSPLATTSNRNARRFCC